VVQLRDDVFRPSGAMLRHVDVLTTFATVAAKAGDGWLSRHATLIVGVVGIIVSGFVGPTVTALFTSKRERDKDARGRAAARREDLRDLLDEAAKVLGGAVANLRPLLDAQLAGREAPREPAEFLGSLFPLGQRLRLRLPGGHDVISTYDEVRERLIVLSHATASEAEWDTAVQNFEDARAVFLDTGRAALAAPISEQGEA
jgi:hypothetical protein